MRDTDMETNRLRLFAASEERMRRFIAAQAEEGLKAAYTEMLNGCLTHPDQWEWYAIWMIELTDGAHVGYSFWQERWRELNMNEALQPFVDTVFKNDVPILLENGEYLPTIYILQKGKGLLYNLAPSDANDLREMAKSALEQTPDADAYALAYAPEGSSNGTRMALFTVEFCGRNDPEAAVLAVACDLDAKKMVSDCVQRPSADSLFSRPQNGLCS